MSSGEAKLMQGRCDQEELERSFQPSVEGLNRAV